MPALITLIFHISFGRKIDCRRNFKQGDILSLKNIHVIFSSTSQIIEPSWTFNKALYTLSCCYKLSTRKTFSKKMTNLTPNLDKN